MSRVTSLPSSNSAEVLGSFDYHASSGEVTKPQRTAPGHNQRRSPFVQSYHQLPVAVVVVSRQSVAQSSCYVTRA